MQPPALICRSCLCCTGDEQCHKLCFAFVWDICPFSALMSHAAHRCTLSCRSLWSHTEVTCTDIHVAVNLDLWPSKVWASLRPSVERRWQVYLSKHEVSAFAVSRTLRATSCTWVLAELASPIGLSFCWCTNLIVLHWIIWVVIHLL